MGPFLCKGIGVENVFRDLKTPHLWAWLALMLSGVFTVWLAVETAKGSPAQGWLAIAAYTSLCIFLWPSLVKAAHQDHRHLLTVCIWSFAMVILGIAVTFYSFFAIAGESYAKYDKLLNVVPVFVAIWAAAVGWLIHFKLTTKAHRTNNAFAIIMETRKSSEFLKRAEFISRHFPPGTRSIPNDYRRFFDPTVLRQVLTDETASKDEQSRAEAVLALKYVLNYYEFMAVGIRVGDLDENLVYDTIHPGVCALFERSKPLVEFLSDPENPGADASTYCDLKALVARWKQRRATADVNGMGA